MGTVGAIVCVAAVVVLLAALAPLQRIVIELPAGPTRRGFALAAATIGLAAVAELVHVAVVQPSLPPGAALAVPLLLGILSVALVAVAFWAHRSVLAVQYPSPLGEESVTDPAMGIYSRRHLDRRVAEEFSRARRYGQPLSVLMLRLDGFRRLVEIHGARQGDQVLHWLGELLTATLRQEDVAGRLDDERVLIVAPSTPAPGAGALAQRLRRAVREFEFLDAAHSKDRQPLHCTISVGVASLDGDMVDPDRLLAAAEGALAEAREAGTDRVVVHRAEGFSLRV